MNKTRRSWSADLGCCRDKSSSVITFIIVACFFSSMPLIFYLTMFLVTKRYEIAQGADFLIQDNNRSSSASEERRIETRPRIVNPIQKQESKNRETKLPVKQNNIEAARKRNNVATNLIDLDAAGPSQS